MQADYNVIGELLAKYPDLTQEEEDQLKLWRAADENERIFQELINSENRKKMLGRYYEIMENESPYLTKVNSLIDETGTFQGSGRIHRLNKGWTYMAAASILIAIGAYLFISRKQANNKGHEVTQVAVTNDIAPGKYKAKLTLADGSVVYLDSAANKIIGQQGSIAVKNNNGRLVYEGKNAASTKVLYNTLNTSKGETYATILSDGSKVWLNSESSVRYPVAFDGDVRKVEITGEAYFEVAHLNRPFIVDMPNLQVEVLGTHFNINSYTNENEIRTTLLEGKVKVLTKNTNEQTILVPGEQARMSKQTQALDKTKDVDVDAAVAWRFGYFQFNNADLPVVMRQLERWYDVQTVYEGNVPRREFLGKIPRNLNLSQALDVLQMLKVHFKIEGKKIIVSP